MKFLLKSIYCAIIILNTGLLAYAQAGIEQPVNVYIGIYVNQIYDISLRENRFAADFYIWFRWQGDDVNPIESFELVNGQITSREGLYTDIIENFNYASYRVNAVVTKFWDVSEFPLDKHQLTIAIEDNDNESHLLRYIPDTENCSLNPGVEIPGYYITKSWPEVLDHRYQTNYGDISLPTNSESVYSRFIYSISIQRPGFGYFFKLFFGVFIAALIAFLAFFIKPTDLDPRFGLGIGAIFAAVASEYVITSSLPDSNILTLADKLHILAFAFIFISLAESTISLKIFSGGREELSKRIDILSFYVCMVVYAALNAIFIIFR